MEAFDTIDHEIILRKLLGLYFGLETRLDGHTDLLGTSE